MGNFKEIEAATCKFYARQNGLLIAISGFGEAARTSSLVEGYCGNSCQRCLAGAPVVSLGEVGQEWRGSGLFAVGLLGVEHQKECPLFEEFGSTGATEVLENRNSNITTSLSHIIRTFEDFRLVEQIREEMGKVRPCLSYTADLASSKH